MAPYPEIPKGSRGGAEAEECQAPYSVDKCPEEGLVALQRAVDAVMAVELRNGLRIGFRSSG